jgi:hypothetical protein
MRRFEALTTGQLRAVRQILENEGHPVPTDLLAELERRGEILQ